MLSSHITHTLDPYHRTNRKSAMRSKGCGEGAGGGNHRKVRAANGGRGQTF